MVGLSKKMMNGQVKLFVLKLKRFFMLKNLNIKMYVEDNCICFITFNLLTFFRLLFQFDLFVTLLLFNLLFNHSFFKRFL